MDNKKEEHSITNLNQQIKNIGYLNEKLKSQSTNPYDDSDLN